MEMVGAKGSPVSRVPCRARCRYIKGSNHVTYFPSCRFVLCSDKLFTLPLLSDPTFQIFYYLNSSPFTSRDILEKPITLFLKIRYIYIYIPLFLAKFYDNRQHLSYMAGFSFWFLFKLFTYLKKKKKHIYQVKLFDKLKQMFKET